LTLTGSTLVPKNWDHDRVKGVARRFATDTAVGAEGDRVEVAHIREKV
jgi:hypothetical protein